MKALPAGYRLSFDEIDAAAAHAFLTTAYWCEGIPQATVERAIAHSLCIALHAEGQGQVGFARVVTDRTTFACAMFTCSKGIAAKGSPMG